MNLVLAFVLALAAGWPSASAPSAAGFPLQIRDAFGRQITVPRPPQRIVSVAPSVTEVLFVLGVGGRVVGIGDADNYPPAGVRGKPRVGGVILDVERILNLRPDLVVGVASLQRAQLERLIRVRLPVLAVEAHSLEETLSQIVLLGRVTNARPAADRAVRLLRVRIDAVGRSVRGLPRPRVYVEIWGEPPQTAAGGTFIDDLLRRARGKNLFPDLRGWPQISPEAVLRRNPQVILLTYPGARRLGRRAGWARVDAVRRGRVYELDPDLVSRPGPRLVDGLEQIASRLHPEVVPPPPATPKPR
ncbi:MAG TPA: helical backbone metal receptor [bacterium]|jgi:iron complex transport system substrate-binding protein|nr:helical backbone metal receptor [bacterium]